MFSLLHRRLDTSNHHGTDTNRHDAAELRAVDGHNLPCVLAINVERSSDGLWLIFESQQGHRQTNDSTDIDSVILSRNIGHWTDDTLNRRMETMVILGSKSENGEGATRIVGCLVLVCVPEEPSNRELPSLDPEARGLTDGFKGHEAAICCTDQSVRVLRTLDWASRRLKFSVS